MINDKIKVRFVMLMLLLKTGNDKGKAYAKSIANLVNYQLLKEGILSGHKLFIISFFIKKQWRGYSNYHAPQTFYKKYFNERKESNSSWLDNLLV